MKGWSFIIAILLILSSVLSFSLSHPAPGALGDKKAVKKLPKRYQKWLEEVTYIITKKEKKKFLSLKSNRMRDKFIELFWKMRDPTPGTPANEFKEEHYRRLRYVNKFFGRGIKKGWQTDRGRIYIILGPPWDIERFYNTSYTYPLELWHYYSGGRPDLPSSFHLIFFKRYGLGDFVLYDPFMDGMGEVLLPTITMWKEPYDQFKELLMLSPELARAVFSIDDSGWVDRRNPQPDISSAQVLARIDELPAKMVDLRYVDDFPNVKPSIRMEYSYRLIDLYGIVHPFQSAGGDFYLHLALGVEPKDVTLEKWSKDKYRCAFSITGDISDTEGRMVARIADNIEFNFNKKELKRVRSSPLVFEGRRIILPGRYRIRLCLRNNLSREYGMFEDIIEVPDRGTDSVQLSPPVLAFAVSKEKGEYSGRVKPYQVGGVAFSVNPLNIFPRGGKACLFYQLFIPKRLANSARSLVARYEISDGKKLVSSEDQSIPSYLSQEKYLINVIKKIDFSFPPGDYQLKLRILSGDEEIADAPPIRFTISPHTKLLPPYIYATDFPPIFSPVYNYEKGLEYFALGRVKEAEQELRRALRKYPYFIEARRILIKLYLTYGQYRKVVDLLEPIGERSLDDYDLLTALGLSYTQLGEHNKAIGCYERAREIMKDEVPVELLNRLGEEYFRVGDFKKAKEMFELSLKEDPDQLLALKELEVVKARLRNPAIG